MCFLKLIIEIQSSNTPIKCESTTKF